MKKLFNIDKKLLISLIIVFTMLSTLALAIYKINAETNTAAEYGSNNEHSISDGGEYLTLEHLDSWYDLLCNQKGTTLPGVNRVILHAGGQSSDPNVTGYLTQNDIGMKLFETTLDAPSTSPFEGGPFFHLTYGFYKASEPITCTPLKAYILSEVINNTGNHTDSYEQYAWWLTKESNKNKVTAENLATLAGIVGQEMVNEATAFEQYILDVAGVSSVDQLKYTSLVTEDLERSIKEKGLKGIGEDGKLKFEYPEIEYKPEWNVDVVGGEEEKPTFEKVTVSWDGEEQLYKVGPFSINYIESLYKVAEPNAKRAYDEETLIEWMGQKYVQFAGVTDATLDTNAKTGLKRGTLEEVKSSRSDAEWGFLWVTGEREEKDDAEFPHDGEEFYVAMKYIEDATELTNLEFSFRYMNAGGSYQELNGTYFEAKWENRSKNNYETYYCDADNCSGHRRLVSTTYWVQLTQLSEPKESQQLVLSGFLANRWYETKIKLGMPTPDVNEGRIRVEKQLVDTNGKIVEPDENLYFYFRIKINGKQFQDIKVKGGFAAVSMPITWKIGDPAPTYEVEEITSRNPEGSELISIENAKGTLDKGKTVTVIAKNTAPISGKLEIKKEIVDANGNVVNVNENVFFEFKVYKNGTYNRNVRVKAGIPLIINDLWKSGEPAPTYKVEEVNVPEGYELYRIENAEGKLEQGKTVTVIAKNTMGGKLEIKKEIVDASGKPISISDNVFFEFKIYKNGVADRNVRVKAGIPLIINDLWKPGEPAPTYRVEEINVPEGYELYRIENAEGKLEAGKTVTIVAKNEANEHKGKLKLNKTVVGSVNPDLEFEFEVTIAGKKIEPNPKISKNTNWTWESGEYTWYGNNAPAYTVKEINVPANVKPVIDVPNGKLIAGQTGTVTVTNVQIVNGDGSINTYIDITKILKGDIKVNEPFTYRLSISGSHYTAPIEGTVRPGETVKIPVSWDFDKPVPTYTVEEIKLPSGTELISIQNATGTVQPGKSIKVDIENEVTSAEIEITKQINGQMSDSLKNTEFKFKVDVSGHGTHIVSVKPGETKKVVISDIAKGEKPTYTVEEIEIPESAQLIEIQNKTGTLERGKVVKVIAINEAGEESGKIKITKKLNGNYTSSDEFTVKITVQGTINGTEVEYITVKAGSSKYSKEFKWKKGTTPTYTVEEVNIPESSELVEITPNTGTLESGETINIVVINVLKKSTGRIKVIKDVVIDEKMQDEAIDGVFTINLRITGTFEMDGESVVGGSRTITKTIGAGESFETSEITWYGEDAPTYIVTETELPEGWTLEGISPNSGSLIKDDTIEVTVINSFKARIIIDLTMKMAGDVWEDGALNPDDKNTLDSEENGLIDGAEIGIDGVEVNIYRVLYSGGSEAKRELAKAYEADGTTPLTFPLITQNGGHWEAPRVSVPALKDEEKDAGYTAKYDVEFIYDGQTYEPTKFLVTSASEDPEGKAKEYMSASTSNRDNWSRDSMALDYDRIEVDNRVAEVAGDQPIDSNGDTIGKVIGSAGEHRIDYTSTDYTYGINDASRKVSTVTTLKPDGTALEVFKAKARTSVGYLLYPFDSRIHLEDYDKYIDELGSVEAYKYSAIYNYLLHINLGLVKRENANLSTTKDLYDANVVVNEKLLNYRFNAALAYIAEVTNNQGLENSILNKQIQLDDKEIKYALNLYESDFFYKTDIYREDSELYTALETFYNTMSLPVNSAELDVFLTYKISLYNESTAYDAAVNLVEDYFDSSLTPVNTTINRYVQTADGITIDGVTEVARGSDYSITRAGALEGPREGNIQWDTQATGIVDSNGRTYNKMSTDDLKGIKLSSGEKIDIYVTFQVNKETHEESSVENCISLGDKYNIAEIGNYSTYYSKTYHPEKEGQIAGKIDKNSAPANLNITELNDKIYYEDDTDAAPVINISLYAEKREIKGIAWDDAKTNLVNGSIESGFGQKIGDGLRQTEEDKEFLIGGLTTKLVEKIKVKVSDGLYKEYDFIWPTNKPLDFLGGKTLEELTGFKSEIETANGDGDGLEKGQYMFNSVPAGNYTVRFIYGNKEVETAAYLQKNGKMDPDVKADYLNGEEDDAVPAMYNGQDYKSTVYQSEFDSSYDADGYIKNEWHDLNDEALFEANANDARDDEARRLDVISKSRIMTNVNGEVLHTANYTAEELETEELKAIYGENPHEELTDNYWMSSDTAKLNMEIEKTKEIATTEDYSLKNTIMNGGVIIEKSIEGLKGDINQEIPVVIIKYIVDKIDLGLVERSRTQLILDKQIESIKLVTSDNKTLLYAEFDVKYELEYNEETGTSNWKANVELNKEKSTGTEQLQYLNKNEDPENWSQNFRYINIDTMILQGTTIEIGYVFTALDVGEVDRIGKAFTTLEKENPNELDFIAKLQEASAELRKKNSEYTKPAGSITFDEKRMAGEYVGSIYYRGKEGSSKDDIVTTKVHQIVDYVDNNSVFQANMNTSIDQSWRVITIKEMLEDKLIDEDIVEMNEETGVGTIADSKGISYETANRNNIIISLDNAEDTASHTNKGFVVELAPYSIFEDAKTEYRVNEKKYDVKINEEQYAQYMSGMKLKTTRYVSQETDADDMNFDNISEIIRFENTVGRRDMEAVPGNANPQTLSGVFEVALQERDSSATELVTLTPPTGANQINVMRLQLLIVVAVALGIVLIGIIVIKKKVLK